MRTCLRLVLLIGGPSLGDAADDQGNGDNIATMRPTDAALAAGQLMSTIEPLLPSAHVGVSATLSFNSTAESDLKQYVAFPRGCQKHETSCTDSWRELQHDVLERLNAPPLAFAWLSKLANGSDPALAPPPIVGIGSARGVGRLHVLLGSDPQGLVPELPASLHAMGSKGLLRIHELMPRIIRHAGNGELSLEWQTYKSHPVVLLQLRTELSVEDHRELLEDRAGVASVMVLQRAFQEMSSVKRACPKSDQPCTSMYVIWSSAAYDPHTVSIELPGVTMSGFGLTHTHKSCIELISSYLHAAVL